MENTRQPKIIIQRFVVSEITDYQAMQLAKVLRSIYHRAFGKDTWKEDRILTHLPTWTEIFLGIADTLSIAYCNITLKSYQAPNDYLWVDAIAIDKAYQKGGLGQQLLQYASGAHPHVRWMGARTQNPSFIRLMQKTCYPIFPLDTSYQSEEAEAILRFSQENIRECESADESGVCKNAYSGGRLGDYPEREDLLKIHKMFSKAGVDWEHGDAIIVIGRRNNEEKV